MSARWHLDTTEFCSTARHFVLPLLAGAVVAALQTAQTGTFELTVMKSAVITSTIAGVIRLLQQWVTSTPEGG